MHLLSNRQLGVPEISSSKLEGTAMREKTKMTKRHQHMSTRMQTFEKVVTSSCFCKLSIPVAVIKYAHGCFEMYKLKCQVPELDRGQRIYMQHSYQDIHSWNIFSIQVHSTTAELCRDDLWHVLSIIYHKMCKTIFHS